MSSARKRSAIAKADQEADFQRQRAILAKHHANVMQGFADIVARKADALQARLDALMLEYCPEEMTKEQIEMPNVERNRDARQAPRLKC